ncbi:excalibur calcium-binding domain-containing protein [Pseudarthrobacter sulfonivorans]|uniref:excalibur calcium-binding domain-containing protein n=1 Tax=Pseudarthrobacter sulfonivorans TaxID=121292 RepID=UPI002103C363|nr:excalibur calcium-binding domain-containing protein [Pseudarthrobacter sulfonivorans]
MKKTLALVVLAGLMLTGCGGTQKAAQPTAAAAVAVEAVAVPGVLGLTLDKATDQLKDLGFEVKAKDTVDGKSIISEKNWQVTSQDPAEGASVAKGSTVNLGVKSLEKIAAEKAAADKAAADKAAAEKASADAAAAAKAAADKAAADKAAADQAAQAAQQAAKKAPAPAPAPAPAVKAPAAVYYANCTAVRAAGAAPIYAGTPGYGSHLDRDGDGVACEK